MISVGVPAVNSIMSTCSKYAGVEKGIFEHLDLILDLISNATPLCQVFLGAEKSSNPGGQTSPSVMQSLPSGPNHDSETAIILSFVSCICSEISTSLFPTEFAFSKVNLISCHVTGVWTGSCFSGLIAIKLGCVTP